MKLESIGKVVLGGFGDRIVVGALLGILDKITPEEIYAYIEQDKFLFHWATERQWAAFRKTAKRVNLDEITRERVIAELEKRRLDLLGTIINRPNGLKWLDAQITELKKRLSPQKIERRAAQEGPEVEQPASES